MGKDKNETAHGTPRPGWASGYETTWVELTETERRELAALYDAEPPGAYDRIVEAVEAGWRISVKWSEHYGTAIVSATCMEEGSSLHKRCFLCQHPDIRKALMSMDYVLHERGLLAGEFRQHSRVAGVW